MAERLKATALKADVLKEPWVRIPLLPWRPMKVKKKIADTYNAKQWLGVSESDEVLFLQMHKDSKGVVCFACDELFSKHGVMAMASDKRFRSIAICPGDWIIRDASGKVVEILKDVFFKDIFEPV